MRRTLVALTALAAAAGLTLAAAPASTAAEKYPVSYNFLSSAVLAGTQVNADPPGANDWELPSDGAAPAARSCSSTAPFGNKNTNWQTYAPLLANEGYCVFALTYGVAAGTPTGLDQFGGLDDDRVTSAQQLKAFVTKVRQATGARQVDILGHSQGTLMPNYYAKFLGGAPYIHSYVSLGSALARHQPRRAGPARASR